MSQSVYDFFFLCNNKEKIALKVLKKKEKHNLLKSAECAAHHTERTQKKKIRSAIKNSKHYFSEISRFKLKIFLFLPSYFF